MQYSKLKRVVREQAESDGSSTVTIPSGIFRNLLEAALRKTASFDEQFYLATYSDLPDAIKSKKIKSATEHYYQTGYYEGRMPRKLIIDERYYLDNNPDVVEALRNGVIKTAQEHFDYAGFREGRAPYENFTLF